MTDSPTPISKAAPTLLELATDALRYWEPRRILYNAILVVVTLGEMRARWSSTRYVPQVDLFLALFILAVIANLLYCAAYPADIFVQTSALREVWRRRRWVLFVVGSSFAVVLVHFISGGILGGLPPR